MARVLAKVLERERESKGFLPPPGVVAIFFTPSELRRRRGSSIGSVLLDALIAFAIIPRSVCLELDDGIANLELMPLRMNESKNDKIGACQLDLAGKLHAAGLWGEMREVAGLAHPLVCPSRLSTEARHSPAHEQDSL